MWAPLPLPIAIFVFVLFAWKLFSLRKKKTSSDISQSDYGSSIQRHAEMTYEECAKEAEDECADIMAPILEEHKNFSSACFLCFVFGTRMAERFRLVEVGDRLALKFKDDEIRAYSLSGDYICNVCIPKSHPVRTALKESRHLETYLSMRPYRVRLNNDYFNITVFYKE